jgi:uncharacterized protein
LWKHKIMIIRAAVFATSLATAGLVFSPSPAKAASFDCMKANSADEVTVCKIPMLSELDATLGAYWYVYSKVPMMMGSNGARRDEAQAFLINRSACGRDVGCLATAYRTRIANLRTGINASLEQMAMVQNRDPCAAPAH